MAADLERTISDLLAKAGCDSTIILNLDSDIDNDLGKSPSWDQLARGTDGRDLIGQPKESVLR